MSEQYEPFGEEWEKEMMKLSKKQLIEMLRQYILNQVVQKGHNES